jgi:hypothetical protein
VDWIYVAQDMLPYGNGGDSSDPIESSKNPDQQRASRILKHDSIPVLHGVTWKKFSSLEVSNGAVILNKVL